jgi:hypothetical protein
MNTLAPEDAEGPEWPQPGWGRWGSSVEAMLSEAVALSCNLDPDNTAVRAQGLLACPILTEPTEREPPGRCAIETR